MVWKGCCKYRTFLLYCVTSNHLQSHIVDVLSARSVSIQRHQYQACLSVGTPSHHLASRSAGSIDASVNTYTVTVLLPIAVRIGDIWLANTYILYWSLKMSDYTYLIMVSPSTTVGKQARGEAGSKVFASAPLMSMACQLLVTLCCMFSCKLDISWTTAVGNPPKKKMCFLILCGVDRGPWQGENNWQPSGKLHFVIKDKAFW